MPAATSRTYYRPIATDHELNFNDRRSAIRSAVQEN
jgi:hypothetical protein